MYEEAYAAACKHVQTSSQLLSIFREWVLECKDGWLMDDGAIDQLALSYPVVVERLSTPPSQSSRKRSAGVDGDRVVSSSSKSRRTTMHRNASAGASARAQSKAAGD